MFVFGIWVLFKWLIVLCSQLLPSEITTGPEFRFLNLYLSLLAVHLMLAVTSIFLLLRTKNPLNKLNLMAILFIIGYSIILYDYYLGI